MHSTLVLLVSALGLIALTVSGAPMDVWAPTIIYPHDGTVWSRAQQQTVYWDTSNAPAHITNPIGRIMLRKGETTTPVILAQGFNVSSGSVDVIVPWVTPGSDYTIVLFGDSGDFSRAFSIN